MNYQGTNLVARKLLKVFDESYEDNLPNTEKCNFVTQTLGPAVPVLSRCQHMPSGSGYASLSIIWPISGVLVVENGKNLAK